jgi:hypothetical protein
MQIHGPATRLLARGHFAKELFWTYGEKTASSICHKLLLQNDLQSGDLTL